MSIRSTIGRQARVLVSPLPSTLSESKAILNTLQSFGPVSAFLNPRYVPGLKSQPRATFLAIYDETRALDKARAASPLSIDVGHNEPDPKEVDPYNMRGLWDRKRIEKRTFHCEVIEDEDVQAHQPIVEENVYHGPFTIDKLPMSFQDLMRQHTPLQELADSFQKTKMTLTEKEKARRARLMKKYSFYSGEGPPDDEGLMGMWRAAVSAQDGNPTDKTQVQEPVKMARDLRR